MLIVTMSSTRSSLEMKSALNAAYQASIAGGSLNLTAEQQATFSGTTLQVMVVGGDNPGEPLSCRMAGQPGTGRVGRAIRCRTTILLPWLGRGTEDR